MPPPYFLPIPSGHILFLQLNVVTLLNGWRRPGDLARIDEHVSTVSDTKRTVAKSSAITKDEGITVDGVIYKARPFLNSLL